MLRSLRRVSLVTFSLFVAFWVAEGVVGTVAPLPKANLRLYRTDPYLPYALKGSMSQLIDTGETRWTVRTAADSSRMGPVELAPGQPHLLGLGDSFAFGYGLDTEETTYAVATANASIPPIRNYGVPGYGPAQYRGMLTRHVEDPGLLGVVLTTYLGNDIHDTLWDKNVPVVDGFLTYHKAGLRSALATRSQIYRILSNTAHRLGIGRGADSIELERQLMDPRAWQTGDLAEARRAYRLEMVAIRDSCRGRGIPLLVLIIPPHAAIDDALRDRLLAQQGDVSVSEELDARFAVREVRSILDELGIEFVDATPVLAKMGKNVFFRFDGHLTPSAARVVGFALGERLAEMTWRDPQRLARRD